MGYLEGVDKVRGGYSSSYGVYNGQRIGILGNHGASAGYKLNGQSSYLDRLWSGKHRTFRSRRLPKFHFRSR